MSLITVYRVEDNRQCGPYRVQARHTEVQTSAAEGMSIRHSDFWRARLDGLSFETGRHLHPGPDDDAFNLRWSMMSFTRTALSYRFGLPSPRRLGEWFFGERETLEILDMHVAVYTVPHQAVLRGNWQVAFRAKSATLVETHELKGWVE